MAPQRFDPFKVDSGSQLARLWSELYSRIFPCICIPEAIVKKLSAKLRDGMMEGLLPDLFIRWVIADQPSGGVPAAVGYTALVEVFRCLETVVDKTAAA
jgi:hypothetical protein